ncbi:MAG TPA: alcohol dehydrogenase catalytic domain-containing protein [Haliangiales bacterium]|nr:alcohol dehydrogenase catalytic domain-containing protein [Haliangiales bacterium]
MRALTYVGPEKLEWREAPDPRVAGAAQAVVRPIAATPCDLDRAIIMGRTPAVPPFVLGHECVAEVVDVGDGVRGVAVGDRVVVPWHLCCGACDRCLRGLTAHCAAFPQYAMYGTNFGGDYGGFLADLVHVPFADAMLVPLPAGVPPERAAPASDNLTDAWLAVAGPLEKYPGGPVLIVGGAGSIGLYAVELARTAGARSVDYVDRSPDRLALAESLGARAIPRDAAVRATYPVVVDASGNPTELLKAVRAVAPGGICTSTGIFFLDTPLPLFDMYLKDVTFRTGRPNVGPHIGKVLALLAAGRIHPENLGETAPWEDAIEVLRTRRLKPVLMRSPS